jgi:hypothetical protein
VADSGLCLRNGLSAIPAVLKQVAGLLLNLFLGTLTSFHSITVLAMAVFSQTVNGSPDSRMRMTNQLAECIVPTLT